MASEAKLHSLFEFAPEAIEAVNRDGHIALFNTKTEILFGYTRDELLGRSLLDPAVTQSVLNRISDWPQAISSMKSLHYRLRSGRS